MTRADRRPPRRRTLGAAALAVAGLGVSLAAASLALDAGEPPATALPFGRAAAGFGLAGLAALRVGVALAAWAVVDRVAPERGATLLAGVGLFWAAWAVWQAWLLLART